MVRFAPETISAVDERGAPDALDSGSDVAGGVLWLGLTDGRRLVEGGSRAERMGSERDTVVFGSSHGPRLLDILGSSAAL